MIAWDEPEPVETKPEPELVESKPEPEPFQGQGQKGCKKRAFFNLTLQIDFISLKNKLSNVMLVQDVEAAIDPEIEEVEVDDDIDNLLNNQERDQVNLC